LDGSDSRRVRSELGDLLHHGEETCGGGGVGGVKGEVHKYGRLKKGRGKNDTQEFTKFTSCNSRH